MPIPWRALALAEAHPVKVKILERLDSDEAPASPAMIARELGLEVGKVGYHMRALESAGLVVMVDERPVRGAMEHFFALSEGSDS
jgi:DNA-binding transcriptional ArsR family regulator